MNKIFMNRLTLLAVTLMASMACFAQGKFDKGVTTGLPGGGLTPDSDPFPYKGLSYKVLEIEGSNVYKVQVVGFEPNLLANFDNMDGTDLQNKIEIPHYISASGSSFGLHVASVATDVFKTVDPALAEKIHELVIMYSTASFVNGIAISLPTTGDTFAGMTGLTTVTCNIPGGKISAIPNSSFAASVYKTANLIVPASEGSFLSYAKTAGWREFCKLYKEGSTTMLGDTNGDGSLSISDAQNVLTLIAKMKAGTASYNEIYDINGNSEITITDAQDLITKYQKSK